MKAIVYSRYGGPNELQLKEIEKPIPQKGEVLIKVKPASINSWDWDLLCGHHFLIRLIGGLFDPKKKILGADVSGVVEAVGHEVQHFKIGDEVFGDIAESGFGAFAEYVATPEKLLTHKPASINFEQAAALPQAGLLALQGLRYKGEILTGQQILINGAAGGVGTLALQYARSRGAEVSCVDLPEKFDLLRSLGASELIDYTKEDYTKRGKQYDKILDVIAHRSVADYKRALKPGGVFSMIGGSMGGLLLQMMVLGPLISSFGNKKVGIMGYRPNRVDLDQLGALCAAGTVIPVIEKVYSLPETADAFRHFGTGKVLGKIVIKI